MKAQGEFEYWLEKGDKFYDDFQGNVQKERYNKVAFYLHQATEKGKSAGSRVITYLHAAQNALYLMTIYDKSGQETVSDHMLKQLLKHIP